MVAHVSKLEFVADFDKYMEQAEATGNPLTFTEGGKPILEVVRVSRTGGDSSSLPEPTTKAS